MYAGLARVGHRRFRRFARDERVDAALDRFPEVAVAATRDDADRVNGLAVAREVEDVVAVERALPAVEPLGDAHAAPPRSPDPADRPAVGLGERLDRLEAE